jgi:hypothetical protein
MKKRKNCGTPPICVLITYYYSTPGVCGSLHFAIWASVICIQIQAVAVGINSYALSRQNRKEFLTALAKKMSLLVAFVSICIDNSSVTTGLNYFALVV